MFDAKNLAVRLYAADHNQTPEYIASYLTEMQRRAPAFFENDIEPRLKRISNEIETIISEKIQK